MADRDPTPTDAERAAERAAARECAQMAVTALLAAVPGATLERDTKEWIVSRRQSDFEGILLRHRSARVEELTRELEHVRARGRVAVGNSVDAGLRAMIAEGERDNADLDLTRCLEKCDSLRATVERYQEQERRAEHPCGVCNEHHWVCKKCVHDPAVTAQAAEIARLRDAATRSRDIAFRQTSAVNADAVVEHLGRIIVDIDRTLKRALAPTEEPKDG